MKLIATPHLPLLMKVGVKHMSDRKVIVKLRIDSDVLDWFLEQGDDPQAYINALLRSHMEERKKQRINFLEIQQIKRELTSKIQ
jgi:hypothetical protein